jgi:hypothetical protein
MTREKRKGERGNDKREEKKEKRMAQNAAVC